MYILDKIEHQSLKSAFVVEWLMYLKSDDKSMKKFHNAKAYYKKKKDIIKVLELTIAYEIYKMEIE